MEIEKTGLLKLRKLVFFQEKESLRSGKLPSDPKIGSENLCNQSQVAMSANKMVSDLEKTKPTSEKQN